VAQARTKYDISERWACRLLHQWRSTQRYTPLRRLDEDALTTAVIALAGQYGRCGYRRVTALLNHRGWPVGKDRVPRIWRRRG
jgi:putative transposase